MFVNMDSFFVTVLQLWWSFCPYLLWHVWSTEAFIVENVLQMLHFSLFGCRCMPEALDGAIYNQRQPPAPTPPPPQKKKKKKITTIAT